MVLNNLSQAFVIYWDMNTFYPAITDTWMPVIRRLGLPYLTIEDFMNSCIQTFNFSGISTNPVSQQAGLYKIQKRPGYALDQLMSKNFSITFKLSESYISYFIAYMQQAEFLSLSDVKTLYFPPITVALLDDAGFETISYQFHQVTPTSLTELSLSYASRLGQFNTFTWSFAFNYFDIYYRNENGIRILLGRYPDIES